MYNVENLSELFDKVLDYELSAQEEGFVSLLFKGIFGKDEVPQYELSQFNNLIVNKASVISNSENQELFNDLVTVQKGDTYRYELPVNYKAKCIFIANGIDVDRVSIEGETVRIANPTRLSTGFYYEVESLKNGNSDTLRNLIYNIADAKILLYKDTMSRLTLEAKSRGVAYTIDGIESFKIVEFGELSQYADYNHELKRVEMKLLQNVSIELTAY